MNTNLFLKRPVLAMVLSIVLVLVGLLAMRTRPVSQFPEIAPPRVIVSLAFPGASADVIPVIGRARFASDVERLKRNTRNIHTICCLP